MDIDPRRLRILHEVARRGGVMKAAAALHLTPSAISQQLAQLEREVGLPLVDRSQRRITLTPAGRVLAAYGERIEEQLTEARQELGRFTERVAGPVTVAAFPTVIRHLLVPALVLLAERHPRVTPVIKELYGHTALQELRLGSVDLVITERDTSRPAAALPSMSRHRLYDDEYRIVVPPGLDPFPTEVSDLIDLPWIAAPLDQACGQALERLGQLHGFTPKKLHTITEFPPVLALVAAGHGVAIVPALALLDLPDGVVGVTAIQDVGRRRLEALTRVSRTRSGEPDPVQAVLLEMLEETATALAARRPAGPNPQAAGP